MLELFKRFAAIWTGRGKIQPLGALIRAPRPAPTSKLYILRVDFPLDAEKRADFDKALEPIRQKYGLDFLALEPGMTLQRFEDF